MAILVLWHGAQWTFASLGLGNMDEFFNRDYKLNKGMIEQKIMQVVYDVINLKGCTKYRYCYGSLSFY